MRTRLLPLFSLALSCLAATRITVTVMDPKTGKAVKDLRAEDFVVMEDKTPKRVEAVEAGAGLIDVMLLLDTSLVGPMVQPVAAELVRQLQPKEQMAIVSFHSSADLIQDFTSSQELLLRAIGGVKYGNTPRVLDSLFASIDGGFEHSSFRRIILLLTAGLDAGGRVTEKEVLKLARKNGVSIYPIYVSGSGKSLFERLARQTGGGYFHLKDLRKNGGAGAGQQIFDVLHSYYTLTISGNLSLGDKLTVEVKRPEKLLVSALPLE